MSDELTVIPPGEIHPAANYKLATDVAGLCKEIVTKSAVNISGKKYVRCEGWMAIATAHGCVASARDVERIEGGIRAIGEVRKVTDGVVIATAEGFVGDDEAMWQKRPEYARRAMAQTRAISRACRSTFAHVVVLMDAGLSTTPAEEVPDSGFDKAIDEREEKRAEQARRAAPQRPAQAVNEDTGEEEREPSWMRVVLHFGKNKGVRLGDLEPKSLAWYANMSDDGWEPRPFRGRISDADRQLFDALNEYRVSQGEPARELPGVEREEEPGF